MILMIQLILNSVAEFRVLLCVLVAVFIDRVSVLGIDVAKCL